MPEPSIPNLPEVPGFNIHRLLARGGTAEVFLAEQESLNREVALKLLSAEQSDDSFTERFLNEGHLIARLRHPNIITIYDVGVLDGGQHFISMEYVEGGDLERQLDGHAMPELQAVVILRELATCLQFVHEQGIIHRDIKPANVLFRKNGSLVLTDFGIAKLMEDDVKLTQTGATIGSPAYSSPEQAQGLELDARTDIYSLGVMFLEMLLGYNPYKSETFATTSINHIQMPVPQLEGKLKQYQPLINGMLAKEPAQRFAHADDIVAYLANPPRLLWRPFAWLAGSMPSKSQAAQPGNQHKSSQTHRLKLAALVVGAIIVSGWFWQYQQSRQALSVLLEQAEQRMAVKQWLEPVGDSAYFYYLTVLEQAPNHKAALEGRQQLITLLLQEAATAVNNKRLMKPVKRNALYFYQQVLSIEPANQLALEGVSGLASAYVDLAEEAIGSDRLMLPEGNNAYYFYTQARLIDSNSLAVNQGIKKLVQRYLQLAEIAKQEHKLLTPKGESAVDYYQRVLEIDSQNTEAKQGITGLANHYAVLAKGAQQKGEKDKMLRYISRGLSVDPYNTTLIRLQAEAQQGNIFERIFR